MGGLGNQLFQVFTVLAYAWRIKTPFIFPHSLTLSTGKERPTYWNSVLGKLSTYTTLNPSYHLSNEDVFNFPKYSETGFRFQPLPEWPSHDVLLFGYFQSYKYFDSFKNDIIHLLGITEMQKQVLGEQAKYFQRDGVSDLRTVSMHFRLGDYKTALDFHRILPVQYYVDSLREVLGGRMAKEHVRVLYFCEVEDASHVESEISYLRSIFQQVDFVRVDAMLPDWKQLLMMSVCQDHIVANSSFSWFGAYLSDRSLTKAKRVVYPSKWFAATVGHDLTDLFPPEWTQIMISDPKTTPLRNMRSLQASITLAGFLFILIVGCRWRTKSSISDFQRLVPYPEKD